MTTRLSRLVAVLAAIVVGMMAWRRSTSREVPVRPGTWEPAGSGPDGA